MFKSKKIVSMLLAVVMILSMGCIGVFADDSEQLTKVENMIDYSIYDSDMVYIQEHADLVDEYNARLLDNNGVSTKATYTPWNWSYGVFSYTSKGAAGKPYAFGLWSSKSNWTFASIDIYKSAM